MKEFISTVTLTFEVNNLEIKDYEITNIEEA